MKTTIARNSILSLLLIPLALGCFALSQTARAVSPAPDGGYPSGNTAEGTGALQSLTTGVWNTANGFQTLFHDTTGGQNIATGLQALFTNTTGSANLATGIQALYNNTSGSKNTATGFQALFSNQTGATNVADGYRALFHNTGSSNTADGFEALFSNTDGEDNTANGYQALFSNTLGGVNTANGSQALYNNTEGSYDTATGYQALFNNTTGNLNTANGFQALYFNTAGYNNTATGFGALLLNTKGTNNTADGVNALANNTGSNNIGLGFSAGSNLTTGGGNVCIGSDVLGIAGESNTTRIANVYASVASGRVVYVNSDNKIGTLSSSRRYKNEIKPMDTASETILALKPVTFRYKPEVDPAHALMFGLIAEDVEKVDRDLVSYNEKGEVETVRYDAVNAMLLNEFLKEHKVVEEQGATVAELKKQIATLIATVKEQAAQIQKVSAQFEVTKPAPQTVLNNQ